MPKNQLFHPVLTGRPRPTHSTLSQASRNLRPPVLLPSNLAQNRIIRLHLTGQGTILPWLPWSTSLSLLWEWCCFLTRARQGFMAWVALKRGLNISRYWDVRGERNCPFGKGLSWVSRVKNLFKVHFWQKCGPGLWYVMLHRHSSFCVHDFLVRHHQLFFFFLF